MDGKVFKFIALLSSLIVATPSLSCPVSLPKISWSYEVSPKVGREYRRVDVDIVKIEKVSSVLPDSRLSYKA